MEEHVQVSCHSADPADSSKVQENLVDLDLDQFAAFMRTELGGDLLPIERSAIKTYLGWKLKRFQK